MMMKHKFMKPSDAIVRKLRDRARGPMPVAAARARDAVAYAAALEILG